MACVSIAERAVTSLMVATPIPRHPRPADFSPERRATILGLLGAEDFRTADLTDGARLYYTVAALVCNDAGVAQQVDINAALADPSAVQYARTLLRRAAS